MGLVDNLQYTHGIWDSISVIHCTLLVSRNVCANLQVKQRAKVLGPFLYSRYNNVSQATFAGYVRLTIRMSGKQGRFSLQVNY